MTGCRICISFFWDALYCNPEKPDVKHSWSNTDFEGSDAWASQASLSRRINTGASAVNCTPWNAYLWVHDWVSYGSMSWARTVPLELFHHLFVIWAPGEKNLVTRWKIWLHLATANLNLCNKLLNLPKFALNVQIWPAGMDPPWSGGGRECLANSGAEYHWSLSYALIFLLTTVITLSHFVSTNFYCFIYFYSTLPPSRASEGLLSPSH